MNIKVIIITQNLFHHGRFSRDLPINAEYLITVPLLSLLGRYALNVIFRDYCGLILMGFNY